MEPYYSDDLVTLYNADCREVAGWLTADVLVTDPPYGRSWRQGKIGSNKRTATGIAGDQDTTVRDAALASWGLKPAIVFGDLMLAPPPGARQVLVWHKPTDAGARGALGGWRRDAEAIYLLGKWPSGLGGRSSVLRSGATNVGNPVGLAARYGHPHAKPVDVMEALISACPAGVIADPFSGSGSTLVAARNAGRKAIGVELDERYCERAVQRLSQSAFDFGQAS